MTADDVDARPRSARAAGRRWAEVGQLGSPVVPPGHRGRGPAVPHAGRYQLADVGIVGLLGRSLLSGRYQLADVGVAGLLGPDLLPGPGCCRCQHRRAHQRCDQHRRRGDVRPRLRLAWLGKQRLVDLELLVRHTLVQNRLQHHTRRDVDLVAVLAGARYMDTDELSQQLVHRPTMRTCSAFWHPTIPPTKLAGIVSLHPWYTPAVMNCGSSPAAEGRTAEFSTNEPGLHQLSTTQSSQIIVHECCPL